MLKSSPCINRQCFSVYLSIHAALEHQFDEVGSLNLLKLLQKRSVTGPLLLKEFTMVIMSVVLSTSGLLLEDFVVFIVCINCSFMPSITCAVMHMVFADRKDLFAPCVFRSFFMLRKSKCQCIRYN